MDSRRDDTRSDEEKAFDAILAASERGESVPGGAGAVVPDAVRKKFEAIPKKPDRGRPATPPIESVGDFRLIESIATGGMGVLWLAEQRSLKRKVVVKLLRPDRAGGEEAEAVFRREAELLAQLKHPNIVTIHAFGVEDDVAWIAMELLEGRTLTAEFERCAGKPMPIASVLPIGVQIARALAAAHEAGVVHRDVKPSNVFLCEDGRAVLLDFGIARELEGPHLTVSGDFRGTPSYSAPEQIAVNHGRIGPATDVFALGVTLYEMLVGALPFPGETTDQVFLGILTREPTAPRIANPALSRDIETVLMKAVEKDPKDRYASASEFADDLQAVIEYRPIHARPAGALTRLTKWMRRNRALTVAGLVVLASLAALPLLVAKSRRADGQRRLGVARDSLARMASTRERLLAVERELEPLARALNLRHLTQDDHRKLAEGIGERDRLEREHGATYLGALADAADAQRVLGTEAVEPTIAAIHLERWRRAIDADDRTGIDVYAKLASERDAEGRFRAELDPRHSVALSSVPDGATIQLFRFVEQSDVTPGGDARLVPAPVDASGSTLATPLPPGSIVLRVVRAGEGAAIGDLILDFAGHPIADTILVPHDSASGEILAFDRLVSVDGAPIREAEDVTRLYDHEIEVPDAKRRFEFERDGRLFTVDAAGPDALGLKAWEPDNVLSEVGGRATVWHDGAAVEATLPPTVTRTTAIPLFRSPKNMIGTTPLRVTLPAGSYLALVAKEGCESTRLPFLVARERDSETSVSLPAAGENPPGFVYVAGGSFAAGGDPRSFAGFEAQTATVGDFWIRERELVWADWLQYLNDPKTQAEIAASPIPIRFPRDGTTGALHAKWKREADGSYSFPAGRALFPLSEVSIRDVEAFLAWRNELGVANGEAFEYALPTELEWEKAARGADRRYFVFGNTFSPAWVKGRFGHERLGPELGLRFPIDESPYGVYDLTGSFWEACCEPWDRDSGGGARAVRGGDWNTIYEANFRAASRAEVFVDAILVNLGFRLVAHRRAK